MSSIAPSLAQSQCEIAVLHPEVVAAAKGGWRLFPIVANLKKPCIKRWQIAATCDLGQLVTWNNQFPGCNWAVATGLGSGLFVLDVDGVKGRSTLAALEAKYGPLPRTLISRTGREEGGAHYWFNCPPDFVVRNSVGRLGAGQDVHGSGLDIKGEGGFALIPPSLHPSGRQYKFDNAEAEPATAPAWLLDNLRTLSESARPLGSQISVLYEGARNDALFRHGCALRRRGMTEAQILSELQNRNIRDCRPPLPGEEIRTLATNAAKYEPGGPDPLEAAWNAVQVGPHLAGYETLLELARSLQAARPGMPICLPQQRIAELMQLHPTLIGRWCKRAVARGRLVLTEPYIPHRRSHLYLVIP